LVFLETTFKAVSISKGGVAMPTVHTAFAIFDISLEIASLQLLEYPVSNIWQFLSFTFALSKLELFSEN